MRSKPPVPSVYNNANKESHVHGGIWDGDSVDNGTQTHGSAILIRITLYVSTREWPV
ncbi:hypothetical protein PM082_009128 [Marasmius tenuissimus]|nr:hypothetical protein PM082_009128 [Marasmius tenuissimus]